MSPFAKVAWCLAVVSAALAIAVTWFVGTHLHPGTHHPAIWGASLILGFLCFLMLSFVLTLLILWACDRVRSPAPD